MLGLYCVLFGTSRYSKTLYIPKQLLQNNNAFRDFEYDVFLVLSCKSIYKIFKNLVQNNIKKLAVFASGNGSNAEKIFEHFKGKDNVGVALLLTYNPKTLAIERDKKHIVPTAYCNRT